MHEVVTLQLGNLANYAATHFWNTQESYFTYDDAASSSSSSPPPLVDHNVHWRAGLGHDGTETFLPRTIVYDVKAAFGSLRQVNALYQQEPGSASDSLWPATSSAVLRQEPVLPNAYMQSLDDGVAELPNLTTAHVRYWSDYLHPHLHPRSIVSLHDVLLTSEMDRFAAGSHLFSSLDAEHDLVDRDWRPFAEECDLLQGAQVMTALDDAWSGFAASYLEALRDEHPKMSIWVWALCGSQCDRPQPVMNVANGFSLLFDQASMLVPLCVPDEKDMPHIISLDPSSPWHISALLSTAAECAALPSRLRGQPVYLHDMAQSINVAGNQPLASLSMALGSADAAAIDLFPHYPLSSFSRARTSRFPTTFGQFTTIRQTNNDEQQVPVNTEEPQLSATLVRRCTSKLLCPLLSSFPPIFPQFHDCSAFPVRTVLATSSSISTYIKSLQAQARRYVGPQEREALTNSLDQIADAYRGEFSYDSDDSFDD
ncbi:hypothetical protein CDD82_5195 [Ophiocordyceps australis]|uniref:Tubulin nucleotide-binding domain-like protein n=1 Tax=Ophiocordyceps australis TaxID=1399860 RepID=A0A2C5Z2M2_9HYPO|nr:hypothetical protein CDD82_5195 [Ophiocordyceps australis]